EDEATALEAVDLDEIEYEERPAVLDVRKAFDPETAPFHQWGPVFPHFGTYTSRRIRKGHVDEASERADVIVEGVYRPQAIDQVPIEPQVALVVPEAD